MATKRKPVKKATRKSRAPKPIPYTDSKDPVVILSHVARAILDEPKRYDQTVWRAKKDDPTDDVYDYILASRYPACGTICCVAGWVCEVTKTPVRRVASVSAQAAHALGLDYWSARGLFDGGEVDGMLGSRQHAKNGVEHIRKFAKDTWGKDLVDI